MERGRKARGRRDDTEMRGAVCVKSRDVCYLKIGPRRSSGGEAVLCSGAWKWVGGGSPLRAARGCRPAAEEGGAPADREGEQEAAGGEGGPAGKGPWGEDEGRREQAPQRLKGPSPPPKSFRTCRGSLPGDPSPHC